MTSNQKKNNLVFWGVSKNGWWALTLTSYILILYCYSYECFASVSKPRWAHPCLLEPRCSKFESGYKNSLLTTSLENFSRSFQMTTSSNKVGPILCTENCPTQITLSEEG